MQEVEPGVEVMSGYQLHSSGMGGSVLLLEDEVVVVVVVVVVVSTGFKVGSDVGKGVGGTGCRVGFLVGTLNSGVGIRSGGLLSSPSPPPERFVLSFWHSGLLRFLGLLHFVAKVLKKASVHDDFEMR
jgi:hypothetical protein